MVLLAVLLVVVLCVVVVVAVGILGIELLIRRDELGGRRFEPCSHGWSG